METKSLVQSAVEYEDGIELGKAFFGYVGKTILGNPRNLDEEARALSVAEILKSHLNKLEDFVFYYMYDDTVSLTAQIRKIAKGNEKENEINELMDRNLALLLCAANGVNIMTEFAYYLDALIKKM